MCALDALQQPINWALFGIAAVIFVVVQAFLFVAAVRLRPAPSGGSNRIADLLWTVIPAISLTVVFVLVFQHLSGQGVTNGAMPTGDDPAALTITPLASPPATPDVTLTGHRWWWRLDYSNPAFTTASDLYIPVGEAVTVTLDSFDVPHTWYTPRTDESYTATPNSPQAFTLTATAPGTYTSTCSGDSCSDPTGYMPLLIVAVPPDEYTAWVAAQQQPAPQPTDALAAQGKELLGSKACLGCHRLNGVSDHSNVGATLSGTARRTLIAGVLPYSPANMRTWLADPATIKPGTTMPQLNLTDSELDALTAYLDTLQ